MEYLFLFSVVQKLLKKSTKNQEMQQLYSKIE